MIYMYVSYGNEESQKWENIGAFPLIPYKDLYPVEKIQCDDSFGLLSKPLSLPNGETILLDAAFVADNNSISFIIQKDGVTLLNIGTFKPRLETFDPSVVFRTPDGLDLSFMFSTRTPSNNASHKRD